MTTTQECETVELARKTDAAFADVAWVLRARCQASAEKTGYAYVIEHLRTERAEGSDHVDLVATDAQRLHHWRAPAEILPEPLAHTGLWRVLRATKTLIQLVPADSEKRFPDWRKSLPASGTWIEHGQAPGHMIAAALQQHLGKRTIEKEHDSGERYLHAIRPDHLDDAADGEAGRISWAGPHKPALWEESDAGDRRAIMMPFRQPADTLGL